MPLSGAKDELFYFFQRSCQLGFKCFSKVCYCEKKIRQNYRNNIQNISVKPFNHYDLEGCTNSPQGMCTPHFWNGVRNGEIIGLLWTQLRNWCSTYCGAWAEKICIDGHVFNEKVSKLVNLRQSVFPHCCLLGESQTLASNIYVA